MGLALDHHANRWRGLVLLVDHVNFRGDGTPNTCVDEYGISDLDVHDTKVRISCDLRKRKSKKPDPSGLLIPLRPTVARRAGVCDTSVAIPASRLWPYLRMCKTGAGRQLFEGGLLVHSGTQHGNPIGNPSAVLPRLYARPAPTLNELTTVQR